MPVCLLKGDARIRGSFQGASLQVGKSAETCVLNPDEPGVPCDGYLCRVWRHSLLFPDEFGGGASPFYLRGVQNAFPQVLLLVCCTDTEQQ